MRLIAAAARARKRFDAGSEGVQGVELGELVAESLNSSGSRARCDFVVESCSPEMARLDEHASAGATTFVEHVAPLAHECRSRSQSLAVEDADQGCARWIEAGP